MTIPAFARSALTVGAYNTATGGYADFSGRDRVMGEEDRLFFATKSKPDVVAPGVEIVAPSVGGGYESFSGTSFATPLVTGSAALLMEWGIVRGNDLFLYGEKINNIDTFFASFAPIVVLNNEIKALGTGIEGDYYTIF